MCIIYEPLGTFFLATKCNKTNLQKYAFLDWYGVYLAVFFIIILGSSIVLQFWLLSLVFLQWTVCVLVIAVVVVLYQSQFVTNCSNAWHSISCSFYLSPFWEWGTFCFSLSLSLSVSSILWCSVSQPTSYNEIIRRMVTKCNCFIWMMHPGI